MSQNVKMISANLKQKCFFFIIYPNLIQINCSSDAILNKPLNAKNSSCILDAKLSIMLYQIIFEGVNCFVILYILLAISNFYFESIKQNASRNNLVTVVMQYK